MKRSLFFGFCASLPLMFGSTNFTVDNADMVFVSGPGPVQIVNGTEIYQNASENGSPWSGLFTRNAGQQGIVLSGAAGQYHLQIWSIPADPLNPQRQHSTSTVYIDVDGMGPFNVTDVLALLASWGPCPAQGACQYDLDGDNKVGASDLLLLLANWDD